ncbi:ferredoxin-NADP reductase [Actinocorallia herbida]|uniref:Ferredoxin-NADP reductase n=1 Tax=Actinocorallia herbida TaxID=58109 RepID=A0A3N1CZQ7_9ACTN|nr:PDR/VanB family oxidoreductase [Actinocorallia herbida]ROO86765.1 ferredoxin-NADP reductase [Actinocorallia herbida]
MSVQTPQDDAFELTVAERHAESETVVSLTLRDPAGGALPAWSPGAHIDLLLDDGAVRQYSLCGPPADGTAWRIAVLREPDGRGGSAHVHDKVAPGGTLRVRGPRNHFALAPAERYLFVAGGIGITPLLPMVHEAIARGADWRLLYGGRSRATMAFPDELTALAAHDRQVRIVPQDEQGPLDLAAFLGAPEPGTLVYCCGPAGLLAAARDACAAWPDGALRTESFTPVEAARAGDTAFEVELGRSGLTLQVPADRSILDTVLEAGVSVLYSCAEGTCGTCETDVLAGEPEHRDTVLTDAEREANQTMMICVSRCRGDRLVLDL